MSATKCIRNEFLLLTNYPIRHFCQKDWDESWDTRPQGSESPSVPQLRRKCSLDLGKHRWRYHSPRGLSEYQGTTGVRRQWSHLNTAAGMVTADCSPTSQSIHCPQNSSVHRAETMNGWPRLSFLLLFGFLQNLFVPCKCYKTHQLLASQMEHWEDTIINSTAG